MYSRSLSLVAAALACSVATAAAQDAVLLRLHGTPGDTTRYHVIAETYVRGGPMAMMAADTTVPTFRVHMYTARALTAVTGDTLTYSEVIDSAQFEAPAMPQMAMMAGQMANSMRGMTTVTKMDSRGRIFSTEATPPPGAMGGMGGMGGQPMAGGPGGMGGGPGGGRGRGGAMGGMSGGRNNQRAFFILPAQPVRPGDTWTDSMTVTDSTAGAATPTTFRATFRLERFERRGGSRIAVISMTGTLTSVTAQGQSLNMNTTGEFQVDLTASRLASLTMDSNGTVASAQGEMPMRMHVTMQAM